MQAQDIIRSVRKIELASRKIVDEITGGAYHSVFKGRGIEFSEVRPYQPGDDVRDIDWNVTARSGSAHIKKYVEERELTVILAVDVSASGAFGSGDKTKRETMTLLSAMLAFSAIRNNDKVGLLLFSDRTELYLPPRSGRIHVLRVIRELVGCTPQSRGTDIRAALEFVARTQKKKAVVFLVSDFLDTGDYAHVMRLLNRRHDLAAFSIHDPFELRLSTGAAFTFSDLENGGEVFFDASGAGRREAYAERVDADRRQVSEACRKAQVDLVEINCGEDLLKPLLRFFAQRKKRVAWINDGGLNHA